jgi:type 2 lantibiotic biosynthesis protein LanM
MISARQLGITLRPQWNAVLGKQTVFVREPLRIEHQVTISLRFTSRAACLIVCDSFPVLTLTTDTDTSSARLIMPSDADYLHERIAAADPLSEGSEEDFNGWREILNVSGDAVFFRRLHSLGLDQNQARGFMRRAGPDSNRSEPGWRKLLRTILSSDEPVEHPFDANQPFARLWAPVAAYALQELHSYDGRLVSHAAITGLASFLHSEVCNLAAEPTYAVFDHFRAGGATFEDFIDRQRHCYGEDIFDRYPALARCLSRLITDWIRTTHAFLARIESDAGLLSREFEIPELHLDAVKHGLSDRHAGGDQVILAHFGERKVLYKPKDMSLESLLPTINVWLSAESFPGGFRFPFAIDCGDYGWAEWIDQKPCFSGEEVKRYYRQAGALLCLAHLLNAKDLLFENLIACGSDPVPIDLETFLQPEARTFDRIGRTFDPNHPAYKWKGSVIDIALLPFWQFSSSHPMCDLSGLGCKNEDLPPAKVAAWEFVNTTGMKPVQRSVQPYRTKNEVVYRGNVQNAADFIQEIESGFAEFHGFVAGRKESFLNFLSQWSRAKSRLIFRPTQLYTLLIQKSLGAKNLQSGIKRSIVFEQIYRPALKSGHLTPDLQRLFDFERDALLGLDVPRFYIPVRSADLDLGDRNPITGFLWESPLETVERRIRHEGESSLQYHLEVIRAALTRKPKILVTPLSRDDKLRLVREYADLIYARANAGQCSALWSPPAFVEIQLPQIERRSIYSGDIGILIFLTAADRVLKRSTSPALLENLKISLENFDFDSAPLGIGNGLGGLIYGSIILGEILEDKCWSHFAVSLSERLPEHRIRSEQEPDLLYGVAGLLLALRKLYLVRPDECIRRQAALCIENLVNGFRPDTGWMRPNGDCSLGFAHGAAGIAYALATGTSIVEGNSPLDLVNKAIEFDRSFFDGAAHNWPATMQNSNTGMRAWCSGLTGMLLSRAGVWDQTRDPQLLAEIEENLPYIPDLMGLDHWCCGAGGAAETLLHIGKILGREELALKGRSMIDQTVRRALKTVYYRFGPEVGENYCFQPSLFRGLAGIGYTLLRSLDPGSLPCILAFE